VRYPLRASAPNPLALAWADAPERFQGQLSSEIDLSRWAGPVRNQGDEGSCSAFSGTGVVELLLAGYTGQRVVLSPAGLYQEERVIQGTPDQDSGATLACTQAALLQYGVPPEAEDPYTPQDFLTRLTPQVVADARLYRISQGYALNGLDDILNALAAGYSPQIGVAVYSSFEGDDAARTGRIPMPGPGESNLGGHALQVTGFNLAEQWVRGPNSWGTAWGDQGHFYLPFAYLKRPDLLMEARAYVL